MRQDNDPMSHPSIQGLTPLQKKALVDYNNLKKNLVPIQSKILQRYHSLPVLQSGNEATKLSDFRMRLDAFAKLNQEQQTILSKIEFAYQGLDSACKKALDFLSTPPENPSPSESPRRKF